MSKIQIFLAGDSTAADYPSSSFPQTGWGQQLPSYFNDDAVIINKAANGRSSKSFIEEGRLDEIDQNLRPDDYLFIQFGHNDNKPDRERKTDPFSTYQAYLRQYVETAISRNATPLLLTPIQRRKFNKDGTLQQTHGAYPEAMKQVAREHSVLLIDMTAITTDLLLDLGPEKSKDLFMWYKADTQSNFPEVYRMIHI